MMLAKLCTPNWNAIMINYDKILTLQPYSLNKEQKEKLLTEKMQQLTAFHYQNCSLYKKMLDAQGFNLDKVKSYQNIPYIPVSLFKDLDLLSMNKADIFKVMTSSGTTGQAVSKIYLNKVTASNQQATLVKIVSDFIGAARMPMLIIDSPSVLKDRMMFSARGAGILGFSIFGSDRTYALNDEMNINFDVVEAFLKKHKGQKILLFGFTFMVWQHFYNELAKINHVLDLSNGILIHGGGWKKLTNEAVSRDEFNFRLNKICGLTNIHDYYGMVEQTGCIYMECKYGHLHASIFSDILIRRHIDFTKCDFGEKGIIQVLSMLPESYPGHSLLTEDEGVILGEDDCPCGRKGKYFIVNGRLKNAEIRGCSDTYADKF